MNKAAKIALIVLVPTVVLAAGYVGWKLYKRQPIFPLFKKGPSEEEKSSSVKSPDVANESENIKSALEKPVNQ